MLARRVKKIVAPTKKQLAAKASRKASKANKSIYDSEKMTLSDAISVLRVCTVRPYSRSLIDLYVHLGRRSCAS